MKIPIFEYTAIYPLKFLGLTHYFWSLHIDTILYTWMAMVCLGATALFFRHFIHNEESLFFAAAEQVVEFFSALCIESFGHFKYHYFIFVTSLFSFCFACNVVGALPFLDEPTKDLNTTIAIAMISFFYIQGQKLKKYGVLSYTLELLGLDGIGRDTGIIWIILALLLMIPKFFMNLIDRLSKIVSMAFRLFGNILGGSVVFYLFIQTIAFFRGSFIIAACAVLAGHVLLETLVPDERRLRWVRLVFYFGWLVLYCLAGAQVFFTIFEGGIQAFVVAMLTISYLSIAVAEEDENLILQETTS